MKFVRNTDWKNLVHTQEHCPDGKLLSLYSPHIQLAGRCDRDGQRYYSQKATSRHWLPSLLLSRAKE